MSNGEPINFQAGHQLSAWKRPQLQLCHRLTPSRSPQCSACPVETLLAPEQNEESSERRWSKYTLGTGPCGEPQNVAWVSNCFIQFHQPGLKRFIWLNLNLNTAILNGPKEVDKACNPKGMMCRNGRYQHSLLRLMNPNAHVC